MLFHLGVADFRATKDLDLEAKSKCDLAAKGAFGAEAAVI
jgi:hypothetical protein